MWRDFPLEIIRLNTPTQDITSSTNSVNSTNLTNSSQLYFTSEPMVGGDLPRSFAVVVALGWTYNFNLDEGVDFNSLGL